MTAFFYGVFLSLGLIIPLGIQNMFIFSQGAMQRRFIHSMPSVLTAFVCDLILILCAVLGVSVIILAMPLLKAFIIFMGMLFMIYMGWLSWHNQDNLCKNTKPLSTRAQIGFAASVSLLNPHALLDTVGVIGANSIGFSSKEKIVFTLGCLIVSFIWFFCLSLAGHLLTKKDRANVSMAVINKIAALVMWLMACYFGWNLYISCGWNAWKYLIGLL